ncbi:hypothetical protein Bca4012_083385 [Brassica carinata]
MNTDGEVRKLTNAHAGDFAQLLEPGVENPDRRPLPQCIYGLIFNEWPVAVSTNASLQLVGGRLFVNATSGTHFYFAHECDARQSYLKNKELMTFLVLELRCQASLLL